VQKLVAFEFIDVAEGAVKALEKLAADHAPLMLKEGVMTALANLVGFFDSESQKRVLNVLNHCALAVSEPELFHTFVEPALTSLLLLFQGDLADKLLIFFRFLLESLAEGSGRDPVQVKSYAEALSVSLLRPLWELLNAQPRLSPKIFEVLARLAAASSMVTAKILSLGVVAGLKASLSFEVASEAELEFLTSAFKLLGALLPESPEVSQTDSEKRCMYTNQPQLLFSIAQAVAPRVLQQFDFLVSRDLRHMALQVFLRVLVLVDSDTMSSLVNPVQLAVLIQELLYGHDSVCVRYALKLVVLAYEKAPTLYSPPFLREGVIARIADWTEPKEERPQAPDSLFEIFFRSEERMQSLSSDTDHRFQRRLSELRRSSSNSALRSRIHRPSSSRSGSNDIVTLSKKALKLHSRFGTETSSKICSELARLSSALGQKLYSTEAVLKWVMTFLDASEGVTSYELFNSGLVDALWSWLTQGLENLRLLQSVCCHTGNFERLLQLLISALRYSETFKANKSYTSPSRTIASLVFCDDAFTEPAIEAKGRIFRGLEPFSVTLDLSASLEALEADLLRVSSAEDFEQLRYSNEGRARRVHLEQLLLSQVLDQGRVRELILLQADHQSSGFVPRDFRGDTRQDLAVEFSCAGTTLPKQVPLSNLPQIQLMSEGVQLEFRFVKKSRGVGQFLAPEAYYAHLLEVSKVEVEATDKITSVLRLLKLLHLANHTYDLGLSVQAFHSAKLTSLVTQVLNDFSGLGRKMLPPWALSLINSCHFLFPFALRNRLMKLSNNPEAPPIGANRARSRSGSFNRHKVTVRRGEILEGARLALVSSPYLRHTVFEYEYVGEEGTGQGPTLEFYFLLSQAIRTLPVWRQGESLFPAPTLRPDTETFTFIGRVVGKALVDDRLLDLPLSPVFWKLVFSQAVSAEDLRFVDLALSTTLKNLPSLDPEQIMSLSLFFTLPGLDAFELKPKGRSIGVTAENIQEYCSLLSKASLMQVAQATAFRQGLEELVDLDKYKQFDWNEIEDLVCGAGLEKWDLEALAEAIVPAHGYTKNSTTYVNLLTVLSQFSQQDRRLFLTFVTGSPRLPIGGFKGLVPPLTVVKKDAGDLCLPSVMTCQNYLKLPDYSDLSVLERALTYAIHEGRENFHFS
jgi:hypothetical protein